MVLCHLLLWLLVQEGAACFGTLTSRHHRLAPAWLVSLCWQAFCAQCAQQRMAPIRTRHAVF